MLVYVENQLPLILLYFLGYKNNIALIKTLN